MASRHRPSPQFEGPAEHSAQGLAGGAVGDRAQDGPKGVPRSEPFGRDRRGLHGLGSWQLLVPVVCLVAGVGFAASANDSRGTDLRAPGTSSLVGTVRSAEDRVHDLDLDLRQLQTRLSRLQKQAGRSNIGVADIQSRAAALRAPAGLTAVHGPGLTVVLDDAPQSSANSLTDSGVDPNRLVVHQSDLQAVVNALWAGGAEAMSIAGQRVIATSAVRCVGNTLLLNGEVYSPPFRVVAIGPAATMADKLDSSPGVRLFQQVAGYYGLGYTVESSDRVDVPAYRGSLTLTYAHPGR